MRSLAEGGRLRPFAALGLPQDAASLSPLAPLRSHRSLRIQRWRKHLNSPNSRTPPRFVRTHEAAAFLGLSGRTLEKHRCTGTGPVFRKLGGRVVYAIEDLEAWAAERSHKSTSDPGYGPSPTNANLRPAPLRTR